MRLSHCKLPINWNLHALFIEDTCLKSNVASVLFIWDLWNFNPIRENGRRWHCETCLFAVKLFEDHGIKVDRAEPLSLSIYIYLCILFYVTCVCLFSQSMSWKYNNWNNITTALYLFRLVCHHLGIWRSTIPVSITTAGCTTDMISCASYKSKITLICCFMTQVLSDYHIP